MPAGRPTTLTAEIKARAIEYLEGGYIAAGDLFPSIAGLADDLGVTRDRVQVWSSVDAGLKGTLERIKTRQERILLNKGISGEFNSNICKLALANHGYSDKIQQDVTSSDGSMTPTVVRLVGVRAGADGSRSEDS